VLVPQLFLISVVTFILIRLLPGDPARLELGPLATPAGVHALRAKLELDQPLPQQYLAYIERVFHGDFGRSWVNQSAVASDLRDRIPATLELIGWGLAVIILVLVPLGVVTASRHGGLGTRTLKRGAFGYGLLAGALPDFWLGLLLIFLFFTKLHIVPGPEGRLSTGQAPPHHITGMYTVDALFTGNLPAFVDAAKHLLLPVCALAFVYGAPIYKMTTTSVSAALRSDYTAYSESLGLSASTVFKYAFRTAAAPIIVITGVICGYLLGGAVLIETIFNLNGIGQYAVQSVTSRDYAPLQAFVLVAAVFTMVVYLIVDLVLVAMDPRVRVSHQRD
jgi:peptide/nickel transport system permease protein